MGNEQDRGQSFQMLNWAVGVGVRGGGRGGEGGILSAKTLHTYFFFPSFFLSFLINGKVVGSQSY